MYKEEPFKKIILDLYRQCGNGGKIAKELKITNYRVYKCLRDNGIEPKKVGGKEKHPVQNMIDMYNRGMSTSEVAHALNMNPVSVWERLKNHGVQLRSRSESHEIRGHTKIKRVDEQDVINMYKSGMSSSEIAKKYSVYKDAVLRVLHKHKIPIRTMYGQNNPAWKGGRLQLNKLIRNSAKYVSFRDEVMRERGYTCEISGERGGKLNVHHIKPFCQLIDDFVDQYGEDIIKDHEKLYKAIDAFEPFWDKSNVILLTEEEHRKMHGVE